MPVPRRPDINRPDLFETRTHVWREAGLEREIGRREASRARLLAIVFLPLLVGVVIAYSHRRSLFPGAGDSVRIATVAVLLTFGWIFARSVGGLFGPSLFRRLDPGTAGTVGFLVRLFTVALTLLVALRVAGIEARALLIGGAVTAVV